MRMLFVTLVLHCCPADPRALFEEFWEHMANVHWTKERLLRYLARKMLLNNAELDNELFTGVDMDELGNEEDELEQDEGPQVFVPLSQAHLDGSAYLLICHHVRIFDILTLSDEYARLNQEQKEVVDYMDELVAEYKRGESNRTRVVYLDGRAGTGKTTVFNTIYNRCRSRGDSVVCAAYTGVAASLLPDGKTLHSAFGLPVPLRKDSVSRLQPHMDQ
jgi:hypothetical protein